MSCYERVRNGEAIIYVSVLPRVSPMASPENTSYRMPNIYTQYAIAENVTIHSRLSAESKPSVFATLA
jgi:hypothetical protein